MHRISALVLKPKRNGRRHGSEIRSKVFEKLKTLLGCSVSLVVAEQPALSTLKAGCGGPLESVYARPLGFNTFQQDMPLS
jgi:hypothetical protein